LREGRLDLAIGTSDIAAHRDFRAARLFEDRYVCMVRKGLAGGADRLSAALFSVLNHVVAAGGDPERQRVDREVLRAPVSRRVSVQLSGSLPVPWVVATSDAVGLIPLRLGKWCAGVLPVDLLEPPMPLPPAVVSVHWHRRAEQSQAIMRVRDELVQVGQELG
jgi:DNA-binding transcriptional LysR family regulator